VSGAARAPACDNPMPGPDRILLAFLLICVPLYGCGRDSIAPYPPQIWEDLIIQVETRPARVEEGMIEFLIIASREPRRPAHNLLVFISIDDTGAWQQAIQDGHMGVYRRALPVTDPENNVLNVRIRYDDRERIMHFPLAQHEAA
jgi:hypothetical protein